MHLPKATAMPWRYVAFLLLGIIGSIVTLGFFKAQAAVPGVIEQALLEDRWQTILEKSGSTDKLGSTPELRAIKGHACLVLNRNDESLELFLSLAPESDRRVWKAWTEKFAGKNPSSPVAYYLKGDALMRLDDPPGLQVFDLAVRKFQISLLYGYYSGYHGYQFGYHFYGGNARNLLKPTEPVIS